MLSSRKFYLGTALILLLYFALDGNGKEAMYCGYKMTKLEYRWLRTKANIQEFPYRADSLYNIYDKLNDAIREAMPDSVEFEVFLSYLHKDEVAVDVFVPDVKSYFETISCVIMNSEFGEHMPRRRYMCLYVYTDKDGSDISPVKAAIKRYK